MEKQLCPLNRSAKHKASPRLSSGSKLELKSWACASQGAVGQPALGKRPYKRQGFKTQWWLQGHQQLCLRRGDVLGFPLLLLHALFPCNLLFNVRLTGGEGRSILHGTAGRAAHRAQKTAARPKNTAATANPVPSSLCPAPSHTLTAPRAVFFTPFQRKIIQ